MLLEMNNLSVSYPEFTLHLVNFALDAEEVLTIVGESSSGKATLAHTIACLLEPEAQVSGQVHLNGRELLAMDERARRPLRMKKFTLSFQNSAEWLNPSLTLAEHLWEVLCRAYRGAVMTARMEEPMALVGLETADLERCPRELSGGMVQKFLLANALALNPALVLLDEPTGALDIASSRGITALIQELNRRLDTAFLAITHSMKLTADLGGQTVVLYDGYVEEVGDTRALLDHPRHPYTRGLLQSAVGLNPVRDVWGTRLTTVSYTRQPHGRPFYGRCIQSLPVCAGHALELTAQPDGRLLTCNRGGVLTLLKCRDPYKAFGRQRVLDGIDLTLCSGEIVSLAGRSGADKTTLARTLAGLFPLEGDGSVEFQGEPADFAALHRHLGGVQMVLQDSQAALNPHMAARGAVEEPMRPSGCFQDGAAERALEDVGLFARDSFLTRHIYALSGGRRQRVAITRALTVESTPLIADEPTSVLDPLGKANLLRMLKDLQNSRGFPILFITHDPDSALEISDRLSRLEGRTFARLNPNNYIQVRFDDLFDTGQPTPQKRQMNMDRQVLWDKRMVFHGHTCGGLIIDFQAARYAVELLELDFSTDEDVVCVTENDAYGVDAIQVLLGCSVGKGNLLFYPRGKQAFSFYNRKIGKAVCLAFRPTPAEYQTKEERFRYLQDAAPTSLFDVKPAVLPLSEKARLFQFLPCDGCGEMAAEHLLRLGNGKKPCLDCFRAYNRFDV